MDTVLAQDTQNEREWSGSRRSLGPYPRILFMLLIALAFFGAVSAASSREAKAGTLHLTTRASADGTVYWCNWEDYGNGVWSWHGCYFGYDGLWHYQYEGGHRIDVYWGGQWYDRTVYFRGSGFATAVYYRNNTRAVDSLLEGLAAQTGAAAFGTSRTSSFGSLSENPEAKVTTPVPPLSAGGADVEAPPTGSAQEEGQATVGGSGTEARLAEGDEQSAITSSATFPWKVAQDNTNSFAYTGWKQVRSKKALGGTYRVSSSRTKGAFFEANGGATDAGGSTMELITATGPKMGKAKVVVFRLGTAEVVKQVTFNLKTSKAKHKVKKKITGLTPHKPYGLAVFSANGRPVVVDAIGYEAHGNMCHPVQP